jgi:hypothetical protein
MKSTNPDNVMFAHGGLKYGIAKTPTANALMSQVR